MKAGDFLKKYKERIVYSFAAVGVATLVATLYVSLTSFGPLGNLGQKETPVSFGGALGRMGMTYDTAVGESFGAPASSPAVPAMMGTKVVEERYVVRNGSISLLVKKAEDAVGEIKQIAGRLNGYVENSSLYDSEDNYPRPLNSSEQKISKYGNIIIRVPSVSFDQAVSEIENLAIKVEKESNNTRDVSAEYLDLGAQLKNLKAEEEQYLSVMKRAVKVEDVLNVSSRLADVRGRIERMQAQVNFLSKQVEMSTISVDLRSEADIESVGSSWRPVSVARQAIQDMLTALVDYANELIIFVINIPVLFVRFLMVIVWASAWVLGLYILWRVTLYIRTKYFI